MINWERNKHLTVGELICFMMGDTPIEGTIIEKNYLSGSRIDYKIRLVGGGECRKLHSRLDLIQDDSGE
jgi:hypothetical protein